MKSLLWLGIVQVLIASFEARAENYVAPILCKLSQSTLQIENTANEPLPFWFQAIGSSPFQENYHEIPAHSTHWLALQDDYAEGTSAIAIKTLNKDLQFTMLCKTSLTASQISDAPSPWKTLQIPLGMSHLKLHLVNLAQSQNGVQIQFDDTPGTAQNLILREDFADTAIDVVIPVGAFKMQIRAEGRFSAKALSSSAEELPLQEEIKDLGSILVKRYFLFTSSNNSESFVAPIETASMIEETLDQIAHPDKARLFVARIDYAKDGTNRDLQSEQKNPWSWSVVEAQNYADFAHISCDGSPSVVEERLKDWMKNTGGTICFWNYRVQREVSMLELRQSPWSLPLVPGFLRRSR